MRSDQYASQTQIAELLVRETSLTHQLARRLVYLVRGTRAPYRQILAELAHKSSEVDEALYILDREGVE